ncbi:MAG TPA: succinylglutamate desuccinylase/aspartoacylase family protein [Candidatus Bathyarchaeia archaeon]|nr:succinylglutamate desuccinylase/aspartoacylase family protein [Candidatus Bathyarchaeia archaeon]
MSTFKIGSIEAQAGKRVCGRLPVENGVLPDGTRIELPIIILNGSKEGPVFTVLAAVHGDELTGVPAIINTTKQLNPKEIRGTLIAIPAANPLAFLTRTRGWVIDTPQEAKNLNRTFPGKADGTMTERIAYTIFNEILLKSTVVLDYHTAGNIAPTVGYRYGFGELSRKSLQLADVAATKLIWKVPLHPGTTHTEGAKRGIITLDSETEGLLHMPVREDYVKIWEKTTTNIMKKLDMMDGAIEAPEHIFFETESEARISGGMTTVEPVKHAGFMMPLVGLMDRVTKGQKLASIVDPFGDEVDTIRSPFDDGIIFRIDSNVVHAGESPISVGRILTRSELD